MDPRISFNNSVRMSAKSESIDAIARGMKNEENRAVNGLPKVHDMMVIDARSATGTDTNKMSTVRMLQPLVTRVITIAIMTLLFTSNDFLCFDPFLARIWATLTEKR